MVKTVANLNTSQLLPYSAKSTAPFSKEALCLSSTRRQTFLHQTISMKFLNICVFGPSILLPFWDFISSSSTFSLCQPAKSAHSAFRHQLGSFMKSHYYRKQLFHPLAALISPKPVSPLPPCCENPSYLDHERKMEHLSSAQIPPCLEDPKRFIPLRRLLQGLVFHSPPLVLLLQFHRVALQDKSLLRSLSPCQRSSWHRALPGDRCHKRQCPRRCH